MSTSDTALQENIGKERRDIQMVKSHRFRDGVVATQDFVEVIVSRCYLSLIKKGTRKRHIMIA